MVEGEGGDFAAAVAERVKGYSGGRDTGGVGEYEDEDRASSTLTFAYIRTLSHALSGTTTFNHTYTYPHPTSGGSSSTHPRNQSPYHSHLHTLTHPLTHLFTGTACYMCMC